MDSPYYSNPQVDEETQKDPDWYKAFIGGMWDEMGEFQFEFLKNQGLKPVHYLLDVGCGSLRGGVHFIKYLEKEHYYGYDLREDLITAANRIIKEENLEKSSPQLATITNFDATIFEQKFDYAVAWSVFTHLSLNKITLCLGQMQKVLSENGKFYATFFECDKLFSPGEIVQYKGDNGDVISRPDNDPYHYTLEAFEWISSKLGLEVKKISDFPHPRNQKMLEFSLK